MKKKLSYTPINYSDLPTPKETVVSDGKGGYIVKTTQANTGELSDEQKRELYLKASRLNQEGEIQQQAENLRTQKALQFLEELFNKF